MTADVELLPLPEGELAGEMRWGAQVYGRDEMHAYARANVAHATAAKDAEIDALRTRLEDTVRDSTNKIEALRAEVEFLRRGIVPRDDDMIVPIKLLDEINASSAEWKDRAEQLAKEVEALQAEVERSERYTEQSERERLWAEACAERLAEALRIAEAALADIGDADREPGDDVSWCKRRAALGLRVVRDTLRNADIRFACGDNGKRMQPESGAGK